MAKVILISLLIFCMTLTACAGNRTPENSGSAGDSMGNDSKLGYGFQPGLVPGKDFVKGQLIVGLKKGINTQNIDSIIRTAAAAEGQVVNEIKGESLLLDFPSEEAVQATVPELIALPQVTFVERNGITRISPPPELPNLRDKAGKLR